MKRTTRILALVLVLLLLLGLAACTGGETISLKCARCGKEIQIPADQYDPSWTYICSDCDRYIAESVVGK